MGLTQDEAVYVLAYAMAAADGEVTEDEEEAIAQRIESRYPRIPRMRRHELRDAGVAAYHGAGPALREVAEALGTPVQREGALAFVIEVVFADGSFDPGEMAAVQEVADALDIDRNVMSRLLSAHT